MNLSDAEEGGIVRRMTIVARKFVSNQFSEIDEMPIQNKRTSLQLTQGTVLMTEDSRFLVLTNAINHF